MQSAHEQLVSTLQHQTFLTTPAVCEKLQAVLQQCALLCRCAHCTLMTRALILQEPLIELGAQVALIFAQACKAEDQTPTVLSSAMCARSTLTQGGVAPVAEIARRFDDNAAIFCSLLRSERLQGQTKGLEAIQQLLLRINFNRFYDRAPAAQPGGS